MASRVKLRYLFAIRNLLGIAGSVIYCMSANSIVVLIGCILCGIWTGSVNALIRVWQGASIPSSNISFIMSVVGLSNSISMATSPALGGVFASFQTHFGPFQLDTY